jgi:4-hydroxy-3-methylbut-2-en-1-yl diphosphate reductase
MDTKTFKRSLNQSEHYHRKGFGHEAVVSNLLDTEYKSDLIQQIRENGYTLTQGDVTIRLASGSPTKSFTIPPSIRICGT